MVIPSSTETLPKTMLLTLQSHWARQEPSCFLPSACYNRKLVTGRWCVSGNGEEHSPEQLNETCVQSCGVMTVKRRTLKNACLARARLRTRIRRMTPGSLKHFSRLRGEEEVSVCGGSAGFMVSLEWIGKHLRRRPRSLVFWFDWVWFF